jgi:diadenylate cyclase
LTLLFHIGFLEVTWVDVADVALVSLLLFQLYKLLRGSMAIRIFLGIICLYLVYLVVKALKMELLTAILGQFMGVGVIAALILFQQEIRKFLLLIGKSTAFHENIFSLWPWNKKVKNKDTMPLTPFVDAAKILGGTNTGALIVFAKGSELNFYAESGDIIDAEISKRLLISIFQKHSPLHDGAVIISKGRIKAARCILPVSENPDLPASFGLRHRAAIGMTEVTDSIVLVVSEETGQISLSLNGQIMTNLSKSELKSKLNAYLFEETEKMKEERDELEQQSVPS